MEDRPTFRAAFLVPRYWPTWGALGAVWLAVQLPYSWQLRLGRLAGRALRRLAGKRRRVVAINLRLCFPELDERERGRLERAVFESVGISIFETGIAWWWPERRLRRLVSIEGLEHLEQRDGQGAILLAMHFTTLEIGAGLLSQRVAIDGMYRAHRNAVFDHVQRRGRERHNPVGIAIAREDVRGMVDRLRAGHAIWYAPDQDYGIRHGVFVPFFGEPAATLTTTSKLARYGRARVVPFTQRRLPGARGYRLTIHPPLEGFPGGDLEGDARRINALVEDCVRACPEQYLWLHRRFKTRPPDAASVYGSAERERKLRGRALAEQHGGEGGPAP